MKKTKTTLKRFAKKHPETSLDEIRNAALTSKHYGGKTESKNAERMSKKRRKMAKASRRRNRK